MIKNYRRPRSIIIHPFIAGIFRKKLHALHINVFAALSFENKKNRQVDGKNRYACTSTINRIIH